MTTWECYCSTLSVTIAAPPEILCSLYLHLKNRYVSTIAAPWCYYCSTIKSILCFFNGKMPTCDWYWWYYCSTTIFTTCRTNKQFDKIIRFETKDFSRFRGLLSVSFFQKILSSNPFFFLIFKFWAKVKKTLALSLPAENQQVPGWDTQGPNTRLSWLGPPACACACLREPGGHAVHVPTRECDGNHTRPHR